jgi:hypothetical protein
VLGSWRGRGAEILCLQCMRSGPRLAKKAETLCSGSERFLYPLASSQREMWSYKTTVVPAWARNRHRKDDWAIRCCRDVHVDGMRGLVSSRLPCAAHRFGMDPKPSHKIRRCRMIRIVVRSEQCCRDGLGRNFVNILNLKKSKLYPILKKKTEIYSARHPLLRSWTARHR